MVRLHLVDREPERAGRGDQTIVVAGEIYDLSLLLKKIHGGEMKSIQGPHRFREGLQGARENRRRKLHKATRLNRARTSSACDPDNFRA